MNEIDFLRAQLADEREHLRAVAQLCSTAVPACGPIYSPLFIKACAEYFMFHIEIERKRLAAWLEDLPEAPAHKALRAALETAEAAADRLVVALNSPERASAAHGTVTDLVRSAADVEALADARAALMARGTTRYTLQSWRRFGQVDADSILRERSLRAEVLRHGPQSPR